MNSNIVIGALLILVFILYLVVLTGDDTEYVCYDGSVAEVPTDCPTIPTPNINERSARESAQNFAGALARSRGLQNNYINIYSEDINWKANFVITDRNNDGEVYETVIFVNGTTGSPSCLEGCGFLDTEDLDDLEQVYE